jgi:hypothetical protein
VLILAYLPGVDFEETFWAPIAVFVIFFLLWAKIFGQKWRKLYIVAFRDAFGLVSEAVMTNGARLAHSLLAQDSLCSGRSPTHRKRTLDVVKMHPVRG